MNKAILLDELMQLSAVERLDIAEKLWDSVHPPGSARPGEDIPLTDEQKAEIDRRLAEHERHPERAEPWETVRERLWSRFAK
jgi:putative addiction module component (TIGR02574 family)